MTIPITQWPINERPREKLLSRGANTLSDAELLAIFLRTGVKGQTAVDLARSLIQKFKSLRDLFETDQKILIQENGVGPAKYVQLHACLEIGKRYLSANLQKSSVMSMQQDTEYFLISHLRHQAREIFSALFLDHHCRLIAYEELFMGTLSQIAVHPREVIKKALDYNAANMIIAHNHPSGFAYPSKADQSLTQLLKSALELMGITLLDHMIVGEGKIFSFSEKGLL